jgi:cysteine desulfurase family protein (TIGR01976 family)
MLDLNRVHALRNQFPALSREIDGNPAIYLDGPAGTQVPSSVANQVHDAMLHHNANRNGKFATSRETDAIIAECQAACASWVGTTDPDEIVFGPNMTSLTFQFSRAISGKWQPGDEIVLTRLDHDANFTPWLMAARDRGVTVRIVDVHLEDATLDIADFSRQLSNRTVLVAVTCASNSVGSLNPVAKLVDLANETGAEVFLDAVHYAPHALIDVAAWGCDYLVCSAYKFFGPHIGILWGHRELLEDTPAYKVRPAPDTIPGRWMTGTQNHACLAGVTAAIEYVASIDPGPSANGSLRSKLQSSFQSIVAYEQKLVAQLLDGLSRIPKVRVFGITNPNQFHERVPTVALTVEGKSSAEVAELLGRQGIFAWHGNYYALSLSERLGQEPHGMLRIGLMHYNTPDEVERTLRAIEQL